MTSFYILFLTLGTTLAVRKLILLNFGNFSYNISGNICKTNISFLLRAVKVAIGKVRVRGGLVRLGYMVN